MALETGRTVEQVVVGTKELDLVLRGRRTGNHARGPWRGTSFHFTLQRLAVRLDSSRGASSSDGRGTRNLTPHFGHFAGFPA